MRIAELRRPSEFSPSPAARPAFFLTGGVPPPPVANYPWLKAERAILYEQPPEFQQPARSIYFPLTGGVARGVFSPLFIPSRAAVYLPTFLSATADAQLFINGVSVNWLTHPGDSLPTGSGNLGSGVSLSPPTMTKILGQPGTFTFAFLSTAGALPQVYDDVVYYRHGIRRFGGYVVAVSDVLLVSTTLREFAVQCSDYNALMERIVVAKLYTLPLGGIITIILEDFVSEPWGLSQFGVTFENPFVGDPDVDLGDVLFHYMLMSACVAQLMAQAAGWYVYIDAWKVLHLAQQGGAGSPAAPYSLSDTSGNFEAMNCSQLNSEYRNRQWVLPSVNTQSFQTDSFTGNGIQTEFFTQYALNSTPIVTVGGVNQVVTALGDWANPYDFYYVVTGQGVFQNPAATPVGVGVVVAVTYPAEFQLAVMAENASEIARVGVVEAIYSPTDVVDQVTAENLAAALLANYCPSVPSQVEYNTNEVIERVAGGWLDPGDEITINTSAPLVNNTYLVQQITSIERDLTVWQHNVIARLQNGPSDYLTVLAKLTQQSLSQPNNTDQVTLVFELGTTVVGISNPGLSAGLQPNVQIYPQAAGGVIQGWSVNFPVTPPTGADLLLDILKNGVSIFAAGVYATLPDGQITEEAGNYFATPNIAVKLGDQFTIDAVQVGSTFGGADGVLQLVVKY